MLIFLTTLLATLSSVLRPRAALQLENIALRHQIGVLQRSAAKRPKLTNLWRPPVLDLPVPALARMAFSAGEGGHSGGTKVDAVRRYPYPPER